MSTYNFGKAAAVLVAALVIAILAYYAVIGLDFTLVKACDAHFFPPWSKYALAVVFGCIGGWSVYQRGCATVAPIEEKKA